MRADKLMERYDMKGHEENGLYRERHYPAKEEGRPASGSSLFFTRPDEITLFHVIDCDEYWCFHAGSPLEVWIIDPEGKLSIHLFGTDEGADPLLYFPKGVIFASKHPLSLKKESDPDGTFFTCITVPRFDYRGFSLLNKEEVCKICPEAATFWEGI